jgi:toxin ParE1/3/4
MAEVIWTQTATQEIVEIGEYLEGYSVVYARKTVRSLYSRATQLASFPEMGRVIPEIGRERYRELIEGNYRLMYELLDEDIILIQRVIHQARDFKP